MPMVKYHINNPCPKCGTPKAPVEYHEHETALGCPEAGEHMHRTCQTCHFEWAEEPLNN
jgi:hypothetical protein